MVNTLIIKLYILSPTTIKTRELGRLQESQNQNKYNCCMPYISYRIRPSYHPPKLKLNLVNVGAANAGTRGELLSVAKKYKTIIREPLRNAFGKNFIRDKTENHSI